MKPENSPIPMENGSPGQGTVSSTSAGPVAVSSSVTNGHHSSNAIVRVESQAGEGLDELFKAVINGENQNRLPQQVPMRQRRLPPSFFCPPSAASSTNSVNHSRESSLDGGYVSNKSNSVGLDSSPQSHQPPPQSQQGPPPPLPQQHVMGYTSNGLAVIHPRANSSPAIMTPVNMNQNNLSQTGRVGSLTGTNQQTVNNGPIRQNGHYRQMSYDLDSIQLPDGWEMSFTPTGERYF